MINIHPCLKLEICSKLQIWYVSTITSVVSKSIAFSTKTPLILLMSAFLQNISMRAVLEIL